MSAPPSISTSLTATQRRPLGKARWILKIEGASVTAKHIFSNDHASRMVRDSGGQDAQKCPIQRIRRQKGSVNSPRSYKSVRKCPFHPILDLAINLGEKKIFRLKRDVTLHDFRNLQTRSLKLSGRSNLLLSQNATAIYQSR
jgi:hypothetical protein